jgi:hypothetical protein
MPGTERVIAFSQLAVKGLINMPLKYLQIVNSFLHTMSHDTHTSTNCQHFPIVLHLDLSPGRGLFRRKFTLVKAGMKKLIFSSDV